MNSLIFQLTMLQLVKVKESAGKANNAKTAAQEGEHLAGENRWVFVCSYHLSTHNQKFQ
jgi:hypothetical protein